MAVGVHVSVGFFGVRLGVAWLEHVATVCGTPRLLHSFLRQLPHWALTHSVPGFPSATASPRLYGNDRLSFSFRTLSGTDHNSTIFFFWHFESKPQSNRRPPFPTTACPGCQARYPLLSPLQELGVRHGLFATEKTLKLKGAGTVPGWAVGDRDGPV